MTDNSLNYKCPICQRRFESKPDTHGKRITMQCGKIIELDMCPGVPVRIPAIILDGSYDYRSPLRILNRSTSYIEPGSVIERNQFAR